MPRSWPEGCVMTIQSSRFSGRFQLPPFPRRTRHGHCCNENDSDYCHYSRTAFSPKLMKSRSQKGMESAEFPLRDLLEAIGPAEEGKKSYAMVEALYPICRSIT